MKPLNFRQRFYRNPSAVYLNGVDTEPRSFVHGDDAENLVQFCRQGRLEYLIRPKGFGPYSRYELDLIAMAAREAAGLLPLELVPASVIIGRLLGEDAYFEHPHFPPGGTIYPAPTTCGWKIIVDGLHPNMNFIGYHELAHYLVDQAGYEGDGPELESIVNYVGAVLMAPAEAVRNVYRHCGENFAKASVAFLSTQSYVVLRYAEVLRDHRALVYDDDYVRVPNGGGLPSDLAELSRLSRGPAALLKTRRLTGPYDIGRRAYWLDSDRRAG